MSLLRFVIASRYSFHNSEITRHYSWRNVVEARNKLLDTIKRSPRINLSRCIYHTAKAPKGKTRFPVLGKLSLAALSITGTSAMRLFYSRPVLCSSDPAVLGIIQNTAPEEHFLLRRLIKYLLPHLCFFLIALASAFVVAMLNIWIPQCVGQVINVITKVRQDVKTGYEDSYSLTSVFQQLANPALKLARMYVAQALFTFAYIYTLSCVGERVAVQLRQDLFKSIIMQDIAFFDKHRTGEIVSRLTSDIQELKSSFKTLISQGLRSVTQIVGCVVSVIVISPQLTGVMVLCMPSIIFVGTLLGRSLRKLSNEAQEQISKSTAVCEEAIHNMRTVRAFAGEEKEMESFSLEVEKASTLYERLGLGIGLFQAGTNLFLNGIILSTLYFGGHLMSSGQLSAGDLMAFLMATQTIQRSLTQLSLLFGTYVRGSSAASRVFEYLDMPPASMMVGGQNVDAGSFVGNIEFRDVTFKYPTRPDVSVLSGFDLTIPAGKTVAIVGSSGNGKSTVAALLERMYDVDGGAITIDGKDIRSVNSRDLRGRVLGYIDQEPVLFSTSIMENIRYGQNGATDDEVIKAAKEANAHDFITGFPQGYETLVGERGTQLSGGQKQRIAIARALIKKPTILILDEATSALDYESERVVQKALENATKGRTVLIIAHRLSTVMGADMIVVLQRGNIVEMGTHADLIEKKGAYFNLVRQEENEKQ
ncbi:mitochondrial potassium channel ATP-binding subunit isoform X1 [Venturia canescens]|uniref:mitochondrial potassium channel ATP-binding subunit isoform X1 n=2 Tax=Venturia canescens TaxID=32260 RepID=UPI001C9D15B8|nr:mitochondrial potassium channel ATP-binding subunit isoform X1 [Venturia canescens]